MCLCAVCIEGKHWCGVHSVVTHIEIRKRHVIAMVNLHSRWEYFHRIQYSRNFSNDVTASYLLFTKIRNSNSIELYPNCKPQKLCNPIRHETLPGMKRCSNYIFSASQHFTSHLPFFWLKRTKIEKGTYFSFCDSSLSMLFVISCTIFSPKDFLFRFFDIWWWRLQTKIVSLWFSKWPWVSDYIQPLFSCIFVV